MSTKHMNKSFSRELRVIVEASLLPMIVMLIITIFVFGITRLHNKNVLCPKFSESIQLPTKYNFWTDDCFMETENGNWVKNE